MLDNKVAVVTGGAKGIGYAIAATLIENGAKVLLADVDVDGVAEAARALGEDKAVGVACDVTSAEDIDRAVATAIESFGSLDIMVNNAGITRDATMRKMSMDEFDTVVDVHLKGAWLGTRAAAGHMRENGGGAIVNISSISGKVGNIGQTNYSAAKAGIVGLTKAAAKEVAHLGVRVNAIQPGLVMTDMTRALRQDVLDAKMAEIPMRRAGDPSEVGSVVLFLASDLSSYMTGCVLEVTGGRYI